MTQNVSAERKLVSTARACQISGFGRQYIERLLRQGRLAGIKPAHDWLVYEDSLYAFLAQPRKRGPKGPRKLAPSADTAPAHQEKKRSESETSAESELKPLRDDSVTSS